MKLIGLAMILSLLAGVIMAAFIAVYRLYGMKKAAFLFGGPFLILIWVGVATWLMAGMPMTIKGS